MSEVILRSRLPEIIAANSDIKPWVVANPVEHTLYNEYGTVNMAAQPMLVPAVEEARDPFLQAMGLAYTSGQVNNIIEKTATDIQGGAATRSRVDTGQMKSGWFAAPEDMAGFQMATGMGSFG